MQKVIVVVMLLAVGCSPVLAAIEASVGAGAVTVGGDRVSASPVIKGDIFANLTKYFALGVSVGEATDFVKRDGRVEIRDNGYMPAGSFALAPALGAGTHHHPHHGDIIIIVNTTVDNAVGVTPTPSQPLSVIDMTERSYFFGEPTVRLSYPLGIVTPFVKGFAGATVLRNYGGETVGAFSSGYGGGLKVSLGIFFANAEYLYRKIEANRTTYNHDQFTGSVGVGF